MEIPTSLTNHSSEAIATCVMHCVRPCFCSCHSEFNEHTPLFMESRTEVTSLEGEVLLVVGLGEELKAFD